MPWTLLALLLTMLPGRAQALSCTASTPGLSPPFAAAECCLTLDESLQFDCLERSVATGTDDLDIPALLGQFDAARLRSALLEQQCHPVAHAVGRLAFKRAGDMGKAFQSCTDSCIFGCQHGVLERFLAPFIQGPATGQDHVDVTRLEEVLPSVCDGARLGSTAAKDVFQCRHGLGHAILFTLGYDLREGLRLCGLLDGEDAQDACVSGIFMENIRAADRSQRDLKPEDPFYPCNAVDDRYRARCASEQSRVFLERGWDRDAMLEGCRAMAPYASDCYEGYGRDASSAMRRGEAGATVMACLPLSGEDRLRCMRGLVRGLIGASTDATTAYAYCAALPPAMRPECFRESREYAAWYAPSRAALERTCRGLHPSAAAQCLAHGLPRQDPVGAWAWRVLGMVGLGIGTKNPVSS